MNDCLSWMRRGAACAAALLAFAATPPAAAQTAPRDRIPVSTTVGAVRPAPPPVVAEGALRLSFDDAVEIALRQNLDIELQRYDRTASALGVQQSLGLFDLRAFANTSLSESSSPNSSGLEGAAVISSENRNWSLGLSQLTPWGGEISGQLTALRAATNSTNALINPQYSATQGYRFTQPLLAGFGAESTKLPILQARIGSNISRQTFEQEVTRVIQSVENAYWAVVEAREQLGVAEEGLGLARELHDRNQVQVDVGTMAPIVLVQSEATVATREEEIIRARAAVGDATDLLLQLLNLDREAYWDLELVPTTDPAAERIEIDLEQAIATALQERPEVTLQRLNLQSTELSARVARRDKLPSVNLVLTYGSAGLAGRGVIFDPETGDPLPVETDLNDAFNDVFTRDFDNWSIGVDVSYAIQNRDARAASTIADLDAQAARTDLDRLRLQVITEVRAAARGVETAAQQIESARVSRRLQERNLEAEQKRYENGMSTSFQVTEIQDDLTGARSREVSAITGYRNALAEFYSATGQLLEVTGVELVEDDLPRGAGWKPGRGSDSAGDDDSTGGQNPDDDPRNRGEENPGQEQPTDPNP